ncbi:MAG: hypothetical protein AAB863_02375, partial [Patescibacteria group bacterium]
VKGQAGKVNIIAHSMGGLLVKDYLNQYGKESVDKLIFVGTPHLGAPKAGKILLEGDRFSIPWLEEDRIQEIAENSPSLHQLLPNQTYFNEFQGYLKKFSLFGDNPLMNYTETKDYFLNERNKNPLMFDIADNFYSQNLHNFNLAGIDTYNITGCKSATQAAYNFSAINDEIGQVGYTSGDGTVPLVSADYVNIPNANKFYVKDGNHAELPSTNGVRELILGILNDNTNDLENNVSTSTNFCNFKGKKLTWHSPVEIHIYDLQGNHTGPIADNGIEYGIPNIDYDVMGHNKFMFLPTDNGETYRIEAIGLEKGNFDLNISEVENEQYLNTYIFNDVPITLSATTTLIVNDNPNDSITVENQGQTSEVSADAVLVGDEAFDLVPPSTQIQLSGKEYKDGEFKKEVDVSFTSTDDKSGILGTWYSLDGQHFIKYTETFRLGEEGVYTVYYYSADRAGNNEKTKEAQIIIGKLSKYLRKLE